MSPEDGGLTLAEQNALGDVVEALGRACRHLAAVRAGHSEDFDEMLIETARVVRIASTIRPTALESLAERLRKP